MKRVGSFLAEGLVTDGDVTVLSAKFGLNSQIIIQFSF